MRGNVHVRFGGPGRGNRSTKRSTLRPGPIPTTASATVTSAVLMKQPDRRKVLGARSSIGMTPTKVAKSRM